jgi:hypothetical protein
MSQLDHVTELLSPYLDGQTSPDEKAAVEAHLPGCDACRSDLADLRALRSLLSQLPAAPAPRSFALGPRALRPAALSGTVAGFARALTSIAAALAFMALGGSLLLQGLPRTTTSVAAAPPIPSPQAVTALSAPAPSGPPRAVSSPSSPAGASPQAVAGLAPSRVSLQPVAASAPPVAAARAAAPAAARAAGAADSGPEGAGPANAAVPRPATPLAGGQPVAQEGPSAKGSAGPAEAVARTDSQVPSTAAAGPRTEAVNVPRLAGELLVLGACLGVAVYSLRWWRA